MAEFHYIFELNPVQTALITGLSGQDGSYLAEFLVDRGYRVIGTSRDPQKACLRLPVALRDSVELVELDLQDQTAITRTLAKYQPAEIYNLAAYSSGAGMFDEPIKIGDINGLAVVRLLEGIKTIDLPARFCQASSREIFGDPLVSPQNETTPVLPRSPYGAAKLYADNMLRIYRRHYGVFACSAILFNHESPRRSGDYVTKKIVMGAVQIKLGLRHELHLGNLDVMRDWGFAGDYVQALWLMLQHETPDDYVVATGQARSVREFCQVAFSSLGLNYRDHVRVDPSLCRPVESCIMVGDAAKIRQQLGWSPKVDFEQLVHLMVDEEMVSFKPGYIS